MRDIAEVLSSEDVGRICVIMLPVVIEKDNSPQSWKNVQFFFSIAAFIVFHFLCGFGVRVDYPSPEVRWQKKNPFPEIPLKSVSALMHKYLALKYTWDTFCLWDVV